MLIFPATERLYWGEPSSRMLMSNTPFGTDELPGSSTELPETALDSERYAHLSLDNGDVVIYDREDPDMWVQSDHVVELDA